MLIALHDHFTYRYFTCWVEDKYVLGVGVMIIKKLIKWAGVTTHKFKVSTASLHFQKLF